MRTAKERQLDMLHSSIWNKLPRFAFPVAATAILEQLFNASDLAIVGNFTGAGAVPGGILVAATPLLIFVALLCYRPSRRFAHPNEVQQSACACSKRFKSPSAAAEGLFRLHLFTCRSARRHRCRK